MVVRQVPTPRRCQIVCNGATALRKFMETAISEMSHVQRCQLYPPAAVSARAHGGVKACRRKHKYNEVVAFWMTERRVKRSGAKKGGEEGGGVGRRPTHNVPHHLFLTQSEYLLAENLAAPSASRAVIESVNGLP